MRHTPECPCGSCWEAKDPPTLPGAQQGGTARWTSESMVALVDAVHAGNENHRHTGGFCGACAEFYVALNAVVIQHTAALSNYHVRELPQPNQSMNLINPEVRSFIDGIKSIFKKKN